MEGSSQAAVTPDGVRDGDPTVLAALVARRGPAVLAFCEAVCEPPMAAQAAAEAFARFRALVATVGDTAGMDPEVFLLGATRHAAASMARPPADDRGVLRVLGRGAKAETTATVPALLAARADDMLGAEDVERLSRLLERSAGCREVEAAFRRAERGYRSPPERPVPPDTVALIVSAMQAAVPVTPGFALVAVPPRPEPEPEPEVVPEPTAVEVDEVEVDDGIAAGLLGGAEIVLPEPGPAPEVEPEPEPQIEPEPEPDPPPDAVEPDDGPEPDPYDGLHEEPVPAAVDITPAPFPDPDPQPEAEAGADATAVLPAVQAPRRPLPRPRLPHGGGLTLPRAVRRTDAGIDHGPVYRLVLPAAAIVIAVLVMLAIAGVFGGGDPAPAGVLLVLGR